MTPRALALWLAIGPACLVACSQNPAPGTQTPLTDTSTGETNQDTIPTPPDTTSPDTGVPEPTPCVNGAECNDGDPCTLNDKCQSDTCVGELHSCDDGLACTRDLCDGAGGCYTELIAGTWCLIGGKCYEDGAINPANPCEACVTPITANFWSASDGADCDDGLECTTSDACLGGSCVGTAEACDDNNPCTTNGCKEGQGCIHAALQGPCEDGDLCSLGDYCNNMACIPGNKTLDCSDGDPCTQDSCSAGGGCDHTPHSGTCNDGDPCTANDKCILGECVAGTQKLGCDDGNGCTQDMCIANVGCAHVPVIIPCEDGNPCTEGDTCSDSACVAGFFQKSCDDENDCTLDACEDWKGCNHFPQVGTCEDGNPCTSNDLCQDGYCKGSGLTDCSDGDVCTDDICDAKFPGGCQNVFNTAPCEDGNPCTEPDTCQNGSCVPNPKGCDDGNPCTDDSCEVVAGCVHEVSATSVCQLSIVITSPNRGKTLTGKKSVKIKGKVVSPVGPVDTVTLNGTPVTLNNKNEFSKTITATHGMNLLKAEVTDSFGSKDKTVQSFYFSTAYKPMSNSNPAASTLTKAAYLFFGQPAIDDGNHALTDADDLATIVELVMKGFDIAALIPSPAVDNSSYKVFIKNFSHDPVQVQLISINGGIFMYASMTNISADIDANGKCFICPDLNGDLSVDEIIISTDLVITLKNGKAKVTLANTDVELINADVDISGILGSILDGLVDYIIGGFVLDIEAQFKQEIGKQIPDMLEDAFNALTFDTTVAIGPFFPGGKKVNITINTDFEKIVFTSDGGIFRYKGSAVAPKSITQNVLGVALRDSCMSGGSESLAMSMEDPLQVAMADDLLNQILFAAWWGGAFTFPLPDGMVPTATIEQYGISDLTIDVEMLLPPMLTSCNAANSLFLQFGDAKIHATMNLLGSAIEMNIFASAEAYVDMVANGAKVAIKITDFNQLETEVVILNQGLVGAEPIVEAMLGGDLIPNLLSNLSEEALGGFALPKIDLSTLSSALPSGTTIELDTNDIFRDMGWTVVSGDVK